LPHEGEIAVDEREDAESNHPYGKGRQGRLLGSGHCGQILVKEQSDINQS
jgi:hypothetical protein